MRPAGGREEGQLRGPGEDSEGFPQDSGKPPGRSEGRGLSSTVRDNSGWRIG